MFNRLFLDRQLSLMIFESRIQGEALKSGPKGRKEIATSVRAWAQTALSIKGGPKGRHSHQPCRTFGARRGLVRSFGPRPDGRGYYLARLRRSRTGDSD
jgi:hypothetical protein